MRDSTRAGPRPPALLQSLWAVDGRDPRPRERRIRDLSLFEHWVELRVPRVRVDRANERRDDRRGRKVVKSARWLLLKNRDSLHPGENVQLQELLAANHQLFVVYVLRDALKELWRHREPQAALRAWYSWYHQALRSSIPPLIRFAQRLRPYLPGILAHCRWPLGTNLVEGINNKIKVIKRVAYGVRAALPGVGR